MSGRARFPVMRTAAFAVFVCAALAPVSLVAEASPRYETHILPILQANCHRCHNSDDREAELDLTTPQGLFTRGESGQVISPGDVANSRLYELVHDGSMPPGEDEHLSEEDVATIRRWIEAGTPFVAEVSISELMAGGTVNNHDIEALMLLHCTMCHGLRRQEAGLDLRTRQSMLKGGRSGPAMVPGRPQESLILRRARLGEMPPKAREVEASVRPMSERELDLLTQWIASGAPLVDPGSDLASTSLDPLVTDKDREFWAFRPPQPVKLPIPEFGFRIQADSTRGPQSGIRNPIDAFISSRLDEIGLRLSPEADRLTLARRASFDLTGLPPEPEDVRRFLADPDPNAYEQLIERLLGSPRYGERWGRYWLDLAGYGDRPHAWRYRDYVIRSFNDDKSYARFLLEQIAGDELVDVENVSVVTQAVMDNLVATGFLRMATDPTSSRVSNFVSHRVDVIADEINIFSSSVLGLTIGCVRCHDHKTDPIPHRDYYRLAALFKGAFDEHDWLPPRIADDPTRPVLVKEPRLLPYVTPLASSDQLKDERRKREAENEALKKEIETLRAAKETVKQVTLLRARVRPEPKIRALWDRGSPSPTYILRRGDPTSPGEWVQPGVPAVLTDGRTPFEVKPPWPGANKTGRRLALARWLTRPDHPLTARVMINRIWKHHFGTGIVSTSGNFGRSGARPTHPDLLDWLAREFVSRGWSVKAMHRLIMTSGTYRQCSSIAHSKARDAQPRDPDNLLLSRMRLRRMEAEVLRDTLFLVAGRLDETPCGPPDPVFERKDGLATSLGTERGWRRSIYVVQHTSHGRGEQNPTILQTFDFPDMTPNCVERVESTAVPQALHLLNDATVRELADLFAERVAREAGTEPGHRIDEAYWIALSRGPTSEERQASLEALKELERVARQTAPNREEAARRALAKVCHTLLNSAAFVYID